MSFKLQVTLKMPADMGQPCTITPSSLNYVVSNAGLVYPDPEPLYAACVLMDVKAYGALFRAPTIETKYDILQLSSVVVSKDGCIRLYLYGTVGIDYLEFHTRNITELTGHVIHENEGDAMFFGVTIRNETFVVKDVGKTELPVARFASSMPLDIFYQMCAEFADNPIFAKFLLNTLL